MRKESTNVDTSGCGTKMGLNDQQMRNRLMATPTPDDIASDVRERSNTALKRGLASRHMQMISSGVGVAMSRFLIC